MFSRNSKVGGGDYDTRSQASALSVANRSQASATNSQESKNNRKKEYMDPPMPNMGKHVNMDLMVDRYIKVKKSCAGVLQIVDRDVSESICEARAIPVGQDTERVKVSKNVSDRIALRRSKNDIKHAVNSNLLDIQKSLLYRKHSINMM